MFKNAFYLLEGLDHVLVVEVLDVLRVARHGDESYTWK